MRQALTYRRVLLKLSGDAFAPPVLESGISPEATALLAVQLQEVVGMGVEVAIVVGGATSGGAGPPRTWTARAPTTWACSPP